MRIRRVESHLDTWGNFLELVFGEDTKISEDNIKTTNKQFFSMVVTENVVAKGSQAKE